jgi:hypothetical protein
MLSIMSGFSFTPIISFICKQVEIPYIIIVAINPILCHVAQVWRWISIYSRNMQPCHIIRKYVLTIWSEHKYIFSHRIVHWVYNYMFRPCILAIVRLY